MDLRALQTIGTIQLNMSLSMTFHVAGSAVAELGGISQVDDDPPRTECVYKEQLLYRVAMVCDVIRDAKKNAPSNAAARDEMG